VGVIGIVEVIGVRVKKFNILLAILGGMAGVKIFITKEFSIRGIVQHGPHIRIAGIFIIIASGYLILCELRKLKRN
jgi:hypothetical protein